MQIFHQYFQDRFAQIGVMHRLQMIEQRGDAITGRRSADWRHVVLDSAIRVVQLEIELAARRDAGREIAVASFDSRAVGISGETCAQGIRLREGSSQNRAGGCLHPMEIGIAGSGQETRSVSE